MEASANPRTMTWSSLTTIERSHRKLEARVAMAGMTLSDYLLAEIARSVSRPTIEELRARLAMRAATNPRVSPAQAVRAEREAH